MINEGKAMDYIVSRALRESIVYDARQYQDGVPIPINLAIISPNHLGQAQLHGPSSLSVDVIDFSEDPGIRFVRRVIQSNGQQYGREVEHN